MINIINGDILDFLKKCKEEERKYRLIFADPPDNLGLKYDSYNDNMPLDLYYEWLYILMLYTIPLADVFWLSYYWKHDLEIKWMIRKIVKSYFPGKQVKTFIWRYTFGQHKQIDFGSGFRFLVRINNSNFKPDLRGLRVPSERQVLGDKRADPRGRIPDDVWEFSEELNDLPHVWKEFPRVVGNSKERRVWHPTQHPEGLIERIIRSSGPYPSNGNDPRATHDILDCFMGTGTVARVCKRIFGNDAIDSIVVDNVEIDPFYCSQVAKELGIKIHGH